MADDDLSGMTDKELEMKIFNADPGGRWWQAFNHERDRRREAREAARLQELQNNLSKPHWTVSPGFWVGVLAMIFAAIAAWPVVREWFPTAPPANTNANSLQPQLHLEPVTPSTQQVSRPVVPVHP